MLGVSGERELPRFRRETLEEWLRDRGGTTVDRETAVASAVLFPDTYTNYMYPDAGRAAVRVLEAAGVHVDVPGSLVASGRAAFSGGFLDVARERAERNVEALIDRVDDG